MFWVSWMKWHYLQRVTGDILGAQHFVVSCSWFVWRGGNLGCFWVVIGGISVVHGSLLAGFLRRFKVLWRSLDRFPQCGWRCIDIYVLPCYEMWSSAKQRQHLCSRNRNDQLAMRSIESVWWTVHPKSKAPWNDRAAMLQWVGQKRDVLLALMFDLATFSPLQVEAVLWSRFLHAHVAAGSWWISHIMKSVHTVPSFVVLAVEIPWQTYEQGPKHHAQHTPIICLKSHHLPNCAGYLWRRRHVPALCLSLIRMQLASPELGILMIEWKHKSYYSNWCLL